jgi:hypothetical protein
MPRLLVVLVVTMLLPVHAPRADDATVLPHGMLRLSAAARFSRPITKRFTPRGGFQS